MTLCAECKPLSYMTSEFNLLQHRLNTETLSFSCRTPFCLLKQWMCLVSCKRHESCDNFVCIHLQMSLGVLSMPIDQKMPLVVLMPSSIAAVKGITIAAAKEHYLPNPGAILCAFSSALSVPRWCVWLLNRSRFNHKWELDQAHEMQPSVLYS